LALLRGRDYVLPPDIADLAGDVLSHRLVLSFDALADGIESRQIIARVLGALPPPQVAPLEQDAA
jgi:MoxR-like ATPase